jgi:hypothetical protein
LFVFIKIFQSHAETQPITKPTIKVKITSMAALTSSNGPIVIGMLIKCSQRTQSKSTLANPKKTSVDQARCPRAIIPPKRSPTWILFNSFIPLTPFPYLEYFTGRLYCQFIELMLVELDRLAWQILLVPGD